MFTQAKFEASGLIDKGSFRRKHVKAYMAQMSKPNEKVLFDNHVGSILQQLGFTWEENPRSIYDPEQLYDALLRYGPNYNVDLKFSDHLQCGIDLAFKVFSKPQGEKFLSILNDGDVYDALQLSSYAGVMYTGCKGDNFDEGLMHESQVIRKIRAPNPCTALKRTQRNNKTRLVWGYPLEMNIMEARFARPLIDRLLCKETTMAFGKMKYEVGQIIDMQIATKGIPVGLDYSKFDATIPKNLLHVAFNIIKTWFSEWDLSRIGFDIVEKYFIYTPIIMPNGHLYTGKNHGIPSGSYFTQVIGSIVNTILLGALLDELGESICYSSILVLGDDSIFPVKKPTSILKMAQILSQYGVVINTEKSKFSEKYFLGAYWINGLPHLPKQQIIEKAVFPESFRHYDNKFSKFQQALSVLTSYASCYYEGWELVPLPRLKMDVLNLETLVSGGKFADVTGLQRYTTKYITGTFPKNTPVFIRYLL